MIKNIIFTCLLLSISVGVYADTIAYYSFEEGSDGSGAVGVCPDEEPNYAEPGWVINPYSDDTGYPIVTTGYPQYVANKSDAAPGTLSVSFGASTNCIIVKNSATFQWEETASKTIEFFIQREGDGPDPSSSEFICVKDFPDNGWGFSFDRNTGLLSFTIKGNTISSVTDFRDGQWHHVAVTHEASSAHYDLYVDYRKESELTDYSGGSISNGDFYLGCGYGWTNYRVLNGNIDEFRVSDKALTSDEFVMVTQERASFPNPNTGRLLSTMFATLEWQPGDLAMSHDVYFGTDPDNLEFQGNTYDLSWQCPPLAPSTTYYWRIDAVANGLPQSPWIGDVWTFSTTDSILLEDFEEYDSESDIEHVWSFSENDPNTNANLQHPDLIVDGDAVYYEGNRGMKVLYDLADEHEVSTASFSPEYKYWSAEGIKALSMYAAFARNSAADIQVTLYDGVNSSSSVYEYSQLEWGGQWKEINFELSEFTGVDLSNIELVTISATGVVGAGRLYVDDLRLNISRCMAELKGDLNGDCAVDLNDFARLASEWQEDNIWP